MPKRNHIDNLIDAIHEQAMRDQTPADVIPSGSASALRPPYEDGRADVADVIGGSPRRPHNRAQLSAYMKNILGPADNVLSDDEWLNQHAAGPHPNPFNQMLADAEAGPENTTLPPMQFAVGKAPPDMTLPPMQFRVPQEDRPQYAVDPMQIKVSPADVHANELQQLGDDPRIKPRTAVPSTGRR